MTQWFLAVDRILPWTIFVCVINVISTNACPIPSQGFVGQNCRYRCRCRTGGCDMATGECRFNPCNGHYFGDVCQYEDMTKDANQSEKTLTDANDTSCMVVSRASIFILPSPLSFFRVVAKDAGSLDKIKYEIRSGQEEISCSKNKFQSLFDPNTRDYFCFTEKNATEIVIIGEGGPTLCSVNVNGGRNLALKQEVETSAFLSSELKQAGVSGDHPRETCYLANETGETIYYLVKFNVPIIVENFIIMNRPELQLQHQLNGYTLYSYGANNETLMTYRDTSDTGRLVHRIYNTNVTIPVSMFKLEKSGNTASSPQSLQFCELKATGDCIPGYHGLECTQKCGQNCEGNICRLLGQCFNCIPKFYGLKCDLSCSEHCAENGLCEQLSGNCTSGCKAGYYTSLCNKACDQGFFGAGCTMRCVGGCRNCSNIDGQCHECNTGKFGKYCSSDCSPNCAGDGACEMSTGNCSSGCKNDTVCAPPAKSEKDAGLVCSPNCGGNGDCNTTTKICSHGCKAGFQGDNCTETITLGSGNDTGTRKVNCSQTGTCHICALGKYGINCSMVCSKNCGGQRMCDQDTGNCSEGCKHGFGGANCSTECGYCIGGLCEMDSLKCTKGCKTGIGGAMCSTAEDEKSDEEDGLVMIVVVFTFLVLGLLVLYELTKKRVVHLPVQPEIN